MDDLENCLEVSIIRKKLQSDKDLLEFFDILLKLAERVNDLKELILQYE
tara:strand:+ start:3774 stop:3920 length:147 start_codon:yes stop_codon:yes gene_type:complete